MKFLDPLIVDDLIYSLAEALNIKIKEIERPLDYLSLSILEMSMLFIATNLV